MAVTINVDRLTSDTQDFFLRTVEDEVHDRIPVVYKMRRMKRVITKGGKWIKKTVKYAKNTMTQHYGKNQIMESGTEDKRTQMRFRMRHTQIPIKYDVEDLVMNDGDVATVDTVKAETQAAQEDMMDKLSENFFGQFVTPGTVTPSGSIPTYAPYSFNAAFYGASATYGGFASYGNLTRGAVNDWADGLVDDLTTINAATVVSFDHWDLMVDSCLKHRGNRKRLLAVCGAALFRKWKSHVRSKEAGIDIKGMLAKAGFAAISIDGVELVLDDNVADNYFYMLELGTWEWRISPKRNFQVTKFKWQGENNDGVDEWLARVMLTHTGMICWKPRNNYMATNMS